MAIYLDAERQETRATTHRVMAAVEEFLGRLLYGPRQHAADLRWSLGALPRFTASESSSESAPR